MLNAKPHTVNDVKRQLIKAVVDSAPVIIVELKEKNPLNGYFVI